MKCIMNPRPDIQEELIKPYKEMEDVYSPVSYTHLTLPTTSRV